jgi:Glycosyl transferase family 2
MKLVMTVLARDEADIVDAQIAFHLHAGVDLVIATDNRSQDGTTEILERYERAGRLVLLREEGEDMRQDEWVTRMARLAATELGADWVINADADEFWWPRGGSLKDVLATIPERFGVVRGCWRHFPPRPRTDPFFAERMTVRLCTPSHPGEKGTIFHAHQKVAHRATPIVMVEAGNHNAAGPGLEPLRAWHPIEVLHFSLRSASQLERKARGGWMRNEGYEPTLHQILLDEALRAQRVDEYFDSFVVNDEALAHGLADGSLALDTRLRDALRALRAAGGEEGGFLLPKDGKDGVSFPRPDAVEDAIYAGEASVLAGMDSVARAERRVDALEKRLGSLEHGPVARLRSKGGELTRRVTGRQTA